MLCVMGAMCRSSQTGLPTQTDRVQILLPHLVDSGEQVVDVVVLGVQVAPGERVVAAARKLADEVGGALRRRPRRIVAEARGHRRAYESGADREHEDVLRCELQREELGEA